jgi:ferredoxin-NADP reductase
MAMEKEHIVKIRSIVNSTHDVLQIITDRPDDYVFQPGQATDVSINKEGWRDEKRPFTFTSLPNDDFLQFTIKTYPAHNGVTHKLLDLIDGDELVLHSVFGAIQYAGPGVFIAGGAGVTPFISIFRNLSSENKVDGNKLIFANKTSNDIINQQEFEQMLGKDFINILSEEEVDRYAHGLIDEDFLKANIDRFDQKFYVCGPSPMMDSVLGQLDKLGVEKSLIVTEEF